MVERKNRRQREKETIGGNMEKVYEYAAVLAEVKRAIAGKDACITKAFATILAGGHILIRMCRGGNFPWQCLTAWMEKKEEPFPTATSKETQDQPAVRSQASALLSARLHFLAAPEMAPTVDLNRPSEEGRFNEI